MSNLYFFRNKVYTYNQLLKKTCIDPETLDDVYPVSLDTPNYSSIFEYPTSEKKYIIDKKNKVCIQKTVYAERKIEDVKKSAIKEIKKEISNEIEKVCEGIDPTLILCSSSSFSKNKKDLQKLSNLLCKKIDEVLNSETIEDIKNIMYKPYDLK